MTQQTDTKTIPSEYGEVEIETVVCDSCGNEVAEDHAKHFALDDRETRELRGADRQGYACPHCFDNGPASFPDRVVNYRWPDDGEGDSVGYVVVFFPLMAVLISLIAIFEDEDYFANGVFAAVMGMILWFGGAVALVVVTNAV